MKSTSSSTKVVRIERCSSCGVYNKQSFCNLPDEILADFEAICRPVTMAAGAAIFYEGDASQGAFISCNSDVKLSVVGSNGKLLLRLAHPGEILGLSATMLNIPYECSAELIKSGQVISIRRGDLVQFLERHGEAAIMAAQQLGKDYVAVHNQMRALSLLGSVAEKFAQFLLDAGGQESHATAGWSRVQLSLTHAEIAQVIGTSRETVTRLFSEFRSKNIIRCQEPRLLLCNKKALESLLTP